LSRNLDPRKAFAGQEILDSKVFIRKFQKLSIRATHYVWEAEAGIDKAGSFLAQGGGESLTIPQVLAIIILNTD
jgi:hypothetical protein